MPGWAASATPSSTAATRSARSAVVASDGAISQGAPSGLTGYTIITADNLDAAITQVKDCPVLTSGGAVEVYEVFPVM